MAEYIVVPFTAKLGNKDNATQAAAQLQELIQYYSNNGWEYVRLESVETYVAGKQGCMGLDNTPSSYVYIRMAVFKK
jgi:ABC-type transporter lipoprotein component MlaA